ncbi:MAG: DNA polymerase III subunit gamma/tau [Acidobacteriota bacterium]
MSYLALARKHRPQSFEEVVGQEPIVTTLRNSLERRRIHHAYLFSGMRGIGKTTTARLLAKALNCASGPTASPCNECTSCKEALAGNAVDIMEIDGASSGGVDQIRELREDVRYTPFRDRYKVVIIDEVHMVTQAAFNALLKTLEEPPSWIVFIFATTEYRKVPATILSRCQVFFFRPLAIPTLVDHLKSICEKESVTITERALYQVARLAAGSSRDGISLLDQLVAYCGDSVRDDEVNVILNIMPADVHRRVAQALAEQNGGAILDEIAQIVDSGYDLINFLHDFENYLRQVLIVKVARAPDKILDVYSEDIAGLRDVAGLFPQDADLLRHLQFLMQIDANLKFIHNPRYLIEAGLLNMCHFRKLLPIGEALKAIEAAAPKEGR